jgi:hypothetical protein
MEEKFKKNQDTKSTRTYSLSDNRLREILPLFIVVIFDGDNTVSNMNKRSTSLVMFNV